MSSFISNSQMYNINTENEVASILSHFNSDFIISIVNANIQNRMNDLVMIPNIISSFEQNFKDIKTRYNTNIDEIERVRLETYKEIIDTVCKVHGMTFRYDDSIDLYSAAYYIYDFFVCNFNNYIVSFFTKFIYKERNSIYDSMGLNNLKKNKDSSTIYAKKVYKDAKLAIINANIDYVISNLATYDISFATILSTVYNDRNISNYIYNLVAIPADFYQFAYIRAMGSESRANLLTCIRLEIQKMCVENDFNIGGITNEN